MDDIDPKVSEAIEAVRSANYPDYHNSPRPSPIDEQISVIVNGFVGMPPEQRSLFRQRFGATLSGWLLSFAMRMAVVGVRQESEKRLLDGLIAIAMEYGRVDYRDDLTTLCLLWHSTKKIKINPQKLFERAAEYAEPENAMHLRRFRTYAANRFSGSGYREIATPEGFDYEWHGGLGCCITVLLMPVVALVRVVSWCQRIFSRRTRPPGKQPPP